MNLLVMNYLITKGYPCTVKNFAAEANIKLDAGADMIEERVEIRNAIHSGDIQSAIEKINELDPQVNFTLHLFHPIFLFCYDYTCFMHHSYTPSSVLMINTHLQSSI